MSTHVKTATRAAGKTEVTPAKTPAAPSRFSSSRSVLLQRKCACGGDTAGGCETCQKKDAEEQQKSIEQKQQKLQKSPSGPSRTATAPPVVNQVLNSPGRALDTPTRSYMEPRFGRDFSGVRVHTDSRAAESARAVDAHAYTVGQHIVFDHGKYDPDSGSGRHLLAHELAHTMQQHGLQRSSDALSLAQTPEYRQLEREADSVAHSVTSGGGTHGAPALTHRPAQPLISRVDKTEGEQARDWEKPDKDLKKAGVDKVSLPGSDAEQGTAVFNLGKLTLPKEKGDVLDLWKPIADAKQLQAIVEGDSAPFLALKQDRPSPARLRNIWLQKVGWSPEDARGKWKDSALKSKATDDRAKAIWDPPKVQGNECQVDHIVELQFGGSSDRENLQMLDGDDNMKAGGDLYNILRQKYTELRKTLDSGDKKKKAIKTVIMLFDDVNQPKPTPGPCAKVENWVRGHANEAVSGESIKDTKSGDPYPIYIGKFAPTSLIISGEFQANPKLPMPIRTSTVPENKSAATLIPGFLLDTLHRKPGKGKDTIAAALDTREGTQLPITLKKETDVTLNVAADGKLTLPNKRPNLAFHYPYLSDGVINELDVTEDGSLSGKGKIRPTVSFLPELDVEFSKDSFKLSKDILPNKLKHPFPGAKITKAAIAIQLAPEFKPSGTLEFEVKPGVKKLLEGKVEITTDGKKLIAKGGLRGFLPGVDDATGTISYQDDEWSGEVNIGTSQLQGKLKYLKSGSAKLGVAGKQITASGQVNLDIPHTDGVSVNLGYAKEKFLFRGKGTFNPPRLKPVTIEVEYDGEHISGSAETEFSFHSLGGRLKIQYHDNRFSGEGDLVINKGKATGSLHVVMEAAGEHPKFSGEGHVTYEISPSLIATAGIEINKEEKVRFKGALEFPKPIPLFPPKGDDYKIFGVDVKIPIPGLSIPKIGGINAKIKGALYAGYHIGPGELRHLKAEVGFSPLEDKPDLDITLSGQFYIGMDAHITGIISGGVEVDVFVASVSGGLGIAATAALKGESTSDVKVHYQESKLDAQAEFKVLLDLVLSLVICAWVHAEAGFWKLKVETTKVWKLKAFKYDSGLKLGMTMKKPIRYISGQGFQFPSTSDIDWITPDIDPKDLLGRLFSAQSPSADEDVDGEKECGQ